MILLTLLAFIGITILVGGLVFLLMILLTGGFVFGDLIVAILICVLMVKLIIWLCNR